MGLRHIKPGLTAARKAGTGIFHPTLRHPLTGEPLEAVGVVGDEPLWPIVGGGEGDDDSGGGGDDDGDDGDDADGDDGDGDDDGDDDKDPKAKIKALEEEKDRHYKRRKKAERELDALRAELDALKAKVKKGKKATEPEDDEDDDDEESPADRRRREEDEAEKRRLKIENAFLRTNTIDWVNPSHVMTLLLADDDYEVEFDDRGNIDRKSLVVELKRFAKANPHLVKPKPAKQGDADGDTSTGDNSGGSASSMNGQRKGKGKTAQPTREQLAKRFPALGGR